MTPEGSTRIVAAIHKATNSRLDYDSIRLKDGARAVAIELGRQPLLMQFGFDTYVFEGVGLPLHLIPFSIDSISTAHRGH